MSVLLSLGSNSCIIESTRVESACLARKHCREIITNIIQVFSLNHSFHPEYMWRIISVIWKVSELEFTFLSFGNFLNTAAKCFLLNNLCVCLVGKLVLSMGICCKVYMTHVMITTTVLSTKTIRTQCGYMIY